MLMAIWSVAGAQSVITDMSMANCPSVGMNAVISTSSTLNTTTSSCSSASSRAALFAAVENSLIALTSWCRASNALDAMTTE